MERKKARVELEAERKRKAEARETKRKHLELQKCPLRSRRKENVPVSDKAKNTTSKVTIVSVVSVCGGTYEDNLIDEVLLNEWICCTNTIHCGLWMHCDDC